MLRGVLTDALRSGQHQALFSIGTDTAALRALDVELMLGSERQRVLVLGGVHAVSWWKGVANVAPLTAMFTG